mgnify:CR=1 FL=1
MAVPNLKHVVEQVRASQPWPFRSKEQLCAYSHACIVALFNTDSNFGKLKKVPAQNHCVDPSGKLGAVDVALYKPTGQIVDFIASAGFEPDPTKPEPPNTVTWNEGPVGEYGPDSWFAPTGGTTPPPTEPPNTELEARVTQLEFEVHSLQSQMNDILTIHIPGFQSQITELAKQIADLHTLFVAKPLPEYIGRAPIFGGTVISRPRT